MLDHFHNFKYIYFLIFITQIYEERYKIQFILNLIFTCLPELLKLKSQLQLNSYFSDILENIFYKATLCNFIYKKCSDPPSFVNLINIDNIARSYIDNDSILSPIAFMQARKALK